MSASFCKLFSSSAQVGPSIHKPLRLAQLSFLVILPARPSHPPTPLPSPPPPQAPPFLLRHFPHPVLCLTSSHIQIAFVLLCMQVEFTDDLQTSICVASICAPTTKRLLLCSVLVLSNSPFKRDTDITDASLANLAGKRKILASLGRGRGWGRGGGG